MHKFTGYGNSKILQTESHVANIALHAFRLDGYTVVHKVPNA